MGIRKQNKIWEWMRSGLCPFLNLRAIMVHTTNYRLIDPDYGINEDFRLLLEEAHRRGIRIIVDM